MTNHERVGRALDLLKEGLTPFVERELEAKHGKYWITTVTKHWPHDPDWTDEDEPHLDSALLLRLMWDQWNEVFRQTLGHTERSIVSELRDVRNRWAHQNRFSGDDAYRALDSVSRLLTAVSASQSDEVEKMKNELLRVRFDEQERHERRKRSAATVETDLPGHLKPWREVVTPHKDVASGKYTDAEFAADLWQVHLGEGTAEYKDPVEFFRRTYLTESLKQLLVTGLRRLSGAGGDPVVQLQTNFGGGKTHSMLALFHLFSGVSAQELVGAEEILQIADINDLPKARPVVLVGNKISPGRPDTKPDGTRVHTLWGELAWQLGGREAYERIREDDEKGTSPGDALRSLFNDYGPCLVLIDEWVAYARQLHDDNTLPAGTFDTQFSFAQALTESAKLAKNCFLVISLPASDTATSPHAQADDQEVGGQRGREALSRLQNVIGRVDSSWRPATAEEGFEIVRRRLFEPLVDREQFVARDSVARSFYDLYRTQSEEFPQECRDPDYERRIKIAYPIHPEVFDRLYNDWSTLVNFQRTRGVLRLMAAVIHSLWEIGDRHPIIMPGSIPMDDSRVQFELTRYLSANWVPVIEKDVDGSHSLPVQVDGSVPNLGKYSASRRVARTTYLGSAPTPTVANRGIEDRRIKLGCVLPHESPAIFGDALRRLTSSATYLYQDGARFWYSTQPTVTKLAEDRAEQLTRDSDAVNGEIQKRVRDDVRQTGDFKRIHAFPTGSEDIPDDLDARLVVLGAEYPHMRDGTSPALIFAQNILDSRGTAPRLHRNSLVFLAPDKPRLQDLYEAVCRYLAWQSIINDREDLDLTPHQVKQAETQLGAAEGAVKARIPETYQWLLVPSQPSPKGDMEWDEYRVTGQDPLAKRAGRRLRNDDLLVLNYASTLLKMDLDNVPLWNGNHVEIKQLIEHYARYPYLARLKSPDVLIDAIKEGVSLITWSTDSFAYADSFDEETNRYRGLRVQQNINLVVEQPSGLIVKPDVAWKQLEEERQQAQGESEAVSQDQHMPVGASEGPGYTQDDSEVGSVSETGDEQRPVLKRFYGSVQLDPERIVRDAGEIANEVITHLVGLVGSEVTVTLEIEANVPGGTPENVVRIVSENSRTLKFENHGFEED